MGKASPIQVETYLFSEQFRVFFLSTELTEKPILDLVCARKASLTELEIDGEHEDLGDNLRKLAKNLLRLSGVMRIDIHLEGVGVTISNLCDWEGGVQLRILEILEEFIGQS